MIIALLVVEIIQTLIMVAWIITWSRIIIPRRRILGVLDRVELHEKEKDEALELAHRENETILATAIDLSKKLRHSYMRCHEREIMINDLRKQLGLDTMVFEVHYSEVPNHTSAGETRQETRTGSTGPQPKTS